MQPREVISESEIHGILNDQLFSNLDKNQGLLPFNSALSSQLLTEKENPECHVYVIHIQSVPKVTQPFYRFCTIVHFLMIGQTRLFCYFPGVAHLSLLTMRLFYLLIW